jgi:serine/threonine protein kinase
MFEVVDGRIIGDGMPLEIPGVIISAELSRGANGIVYVGADTLLERPVAVKIYTKLRAKDARDKALQGMEEARKSWRALRQPKEEFHIAEPYEKLFYSSVVEIYNAGVLADGTFFVVMEFIDGVTLRDWLPSHRFPIGRKFYIAEALTELDAQWGKSHIYHGDLHWNNVMIEKDNRPKTYWEIGERAPKIKILDFGTSYFSHAPNSSERHFRVLAETATRCISPIPLDEILPGEKPKDLGTVKTRSWIQKSICAFRAALFLMGRQAVGWPYYVNSMLGYKVPSHTDIEPAKALIKRLGLLDRTDQETEVLGGSPQWSEFDGRNNKHPGD